MSCDTHDICHVGLAVFFAIVLIQDKTPGRSAFELAGKQEAAQRLMSGCESGWENQYAPGKAQKEEASLTRSCKTRTRVSTLADKIGPTGVFILII
jgi:hypothetical protein